MEGSVDLVTIQCPDCGPCLAPLDCVSVLINIETQIATMTYPCAMCGIRSALRISPESVAVLDSVGIVAEYWHLPAELLERASTPFPPFPARSVRRLAAELENDIEAYLRITSSQGGSS